MPNPNMVARGNLGYKVSYRTLSWMELVIREWGTEWGRPDTAYEWSNGRRFDCTDQYTSGIYTRT